MEVSYYDIQTNLILNFTEEIISEFSTFKQDSLSPESGGMLFTTNTQTESITISRISVPQKKDKRLRFFFKLNKRSAKKIINKNFKEGYHYIGDWHTHPEPNPTPSSKDIQTIKSIFNESDHQLNYMFHVILGNSNNFRPYVGLTDGNFMRQMYKT